jgi:hypothetical protein
MIPTDTKNITGKIEDLIIKPKTTGDGNFVKLKINNQTFNFFDYDYYEKNTKRFKAGAEVEVFYYEKEFGTPPRISKTATAITFKSSDVEEMAQTNFTTDTFVKASEPQKEVTKSVENIMQECLEAAVMIEDSLKPYQLSSDNVTSIGISMFISKTGRRF